MAYPPPLASLPLRDPDYFVAGQINDSAPAWISVLQAVNHPDTDIIRSWIQSGVNILDFLQHFRGMFEGVS